MLNEKVAKLINEQINKELYSAYLYLDMANFYTNKNLDGFANWFKIQAQEERDHALLFMDYLLGNGVEVKLEAIGAPDVPFADLKAPLLAALEHERYITASINGIFEAASEAKEYKTFKILNWFIAEQEEEERNSDELIQKYELFAADGKGLYLLDAEFKGRIYSAPSLVLD